MLRSIVEITAPSRLHFGMFAFKQPDLPQFGGVGAMIATPGIHLRFQPAERDEASGPLAARVRETLARVVQAVGAAPRGPCRVVVLAASPEHAGLGTGTQTALAVAAGWHRFQGLPVPAAERLAELAGRGGRSGVGCHGFFQGGLIVEAGRRAHESFSALVCRLPLPEAWRFVLVRETAAQGLAGEAERRAFADLPPTSRSATEALCREALLGLVPAARRGDCAAFGESLYRFGRQAGECFAAAQGGQFASPQAVDWIDWLRAQGIAGAGQTSWGPTVFALTPTEAAARDLVAAVERRAVRGLEITIAAPDNQGHQSRVIEAAESVA